MKFQNQTHNHRSSSNKRRTIKCSKCGEFAERKLFKATHKIMLKICEKCRSKIMS